MGNQKVYFKFLPVGGNTNRGSCLRAVLPPPASSQAMQKFEVHPKKIHSVALLLLIAAVFISCDLHTSDPGRPPTEAILNADMEFSAMSRQSGMKKAFLEYIDNEGVLLRPDERPMKGAEAIDFLSLLNDTSYTLTWRPSRAEISQSGDLGFTYGIYTLTFPDTTFKGTYINAWKKRSDGVWKLILNSNNPGIK